jgi:hypothetical protein
MPDACAFSAVHLLQQGNPNAWQQCVVDNRAKLRTYSAQMLRTNKHLCNKKSDNNTDSEDAFYSVLLLFWRTGMSSEPSSAHVWEDR